jgi:hypothetical protein
MVKDSINNMKQALVPEVVAAANLGQLKQDVISSVMDLMMSQMAAGPLYVIKPLR